MAKPSLTDVARKYCVEDLSGASIPGSRITKILMQLESGTPLSRFTLEYLRKNGFLALSRYAKSEISFKDFLQIAKPEQTGRREAAEAKTTVKKTRRPIKREAPLLAQNENKKILQQKNVPIKMTQESKPRPNIINLGTSMICLNILRRNIFQSSWTFYDVLIEALV